MHLEQIEQAALNLPDADRALLVLRLMDSLDSADIHHDDMQWIEEAERRWKDYKAGRIKARPMEDVMRDARCRR